MVKRRRLQCIFSNLLSKWKVSSEGGKVGIKLFGHLVGTYRGGGGRLDTNFKGIGSYSCFLSPFSFTRGRKSNWDFKSDQLLDGIFVDKSNAEERVNLSPCHSFKIELKTNLFIKTLSSFGLLYRYVNSRLEKPC